MGLSSWHESCVKILRYDEKKRKAKLVEDEVGMGEKWCVYKTTRLVQVPPKNLVADVSMLVLQEEEEK